MLLKNKVLGRVIWAGYVARMGEIRTSYDTSAEKPEGKRAFGRTRCRLVEYIKMQLKKIRCDGVKWIQLAQDKDECAPVVNTEINLRVS
jgi:hypothetical protein